MQLFSVVIISSCALIPHQPPAGLALESLLTGIVFWITQTLQQIRYGRRRTGHPRYWLVSRMLQTQLATIPFCVAGVLLLRGSPAGLYWLAPAFTFSLLSGVLSAWVLLVEILR